MFERCAALLRKYSDALKRSGDKHEPEYLIEVEQRLSQLEFIVARVRSLVEPSPKGDRIADAMLDQQMTAAPHLRALEHAQEIASLRQHLRQHANALAHLVEIQVLTEAFYWSAWRMCCVLGRRLPGFRRLAVKGVEDVRNKLIEHPEDRGCGAIENGFSFDHKTGPIIKGVRETSKVGVFPDKGLYINAQELADKLVSATEAYLAHHRG